jgi:DAK2 domain fusion protein YloV
VQVLDGAAARRWADAAVEAVQAAREEIDALNVYPVPDGDTGTNLYLTLTEGRQALAPLAPEASLREVSDAFARGCLLGARGNSGIITAQLLRGWADQMGGGELAGADTVRAAFRHADTVAWQAVAEPVEGTVLSVSRAAAQAAQRCRGDLTEVVTDALAAAREALERTPEQLAVLAQAGVVDAGGLGLVVLLEALASVVTGSAPPARPGRAAAQHRPPQALEHHPAEHCGAGGGAFEVMYLLDTAHPADAAALRTRLAGLGESVAVVGGGGLWHVHVHTDDPGAAVEAGIAAGQPHQVRITHLADLVRRAAARGRPGTAGSIGVVAFAAGPGLARLFEGAGAVAVEPPAGQRSSTGEVLAAVRRAGVPAVVVLPNDPDTLAVAQAAASIARAEGLRVTVVPTRTQVQGLAALAVHDPERDLDDDVVAMSAAAGSTRHGAVTVAAREAITMAGRCRPGDVLGVVDGDFAVIGADLAAVAGEVVDRLLSGGGELVTLVTGDGASADLVAAVRARARQGRSEVEVQVLDGGQPRYPLLVGVE